MKNNCKVVLSLAGAVLLGASRAYSAAEVNVTVSAGSTGAPINPAMWGIFFEDINFGADGGLYAEMVKNRSFEFTNALIGWKVIGSATTEVQTEGGPDPVQPHYLRLKTEGAGAGIANEGFRGMGVKKDDGYDFSALMRAPAGAAEIKVDLARADGSSLGTATITGLTSEWKKYTASIVAGGTDPKARLSVTVNGAATVDMEMVSLFPKKTWKNRPGGLRADMVQILADLHPGFMRFPGGCIVEGSQLDRRYQWKNTIGPIESRVPNINRWNYEFRHKQTPDYFQSYGLGFFEFFQLCEDIGATPLPILNCGMACQFNTGQLVPLTELDTYIQDALDLIEFANGPATSPWGAKRAAMGHPAPFNMKMLGVGNEQWGQQYLDRYAMFAKVLKGKYPDIMLVSDAGPSPADDRFNFLWPRLQKMKADIVDQHCYARPIWFLNNTQRYDSYDRKGPKIFMGEYAAQSVTIVTPDNKNNWDCALSEAAYMTGLERNAEVVRMASYAPLFANIDAWQWTPNLIWVDSLRIYGTPNYYAQQLFMQNRGDDVIPIKVDVGADPAPAPGGGIVMGTSSASAEFRDVKITRGSQTLYNSDFTTAANGWKPSGGRWSLKSGAWQQTDERATASARIGDISWTNYTLTLKARKLGGEEGFLIAVRNEEPGTLVQWRLGGAKNTEHSLESLLGVQEQIMNRTAGKIDTGKWYDIKMELKGSKVNCYLDGKLVQTADVPVPKHGGFFASSVRDNKTGEIILKFVNANPRGRAALIRLDGIKKVKFGSKATILTSADLDTENSFDSPTKVVPHETGIQILSPRFEQAVPSYSFLVLRIPVEK
jgi:alpha-L-arabinofuranosidase